MCAHCSARVRNLCIERRNCTWETHQTKENNPWRGEEEREYAGDELRWDLLLRTESVYDLGARVERGLVRMLRWRL